MKTWVNQHNALQALDVSQNSVSWKQNALLWGQVEVLERFTMY